LKQFIEKKIFNMGKLKEKLLNNLTPEEQEEMFGISAFEYVEYMENYKYLYDDNGDPIPEDVLEQIQKERETQEQEYYQQSEIDDINDSVKPKYTDNDILHVLESYVADPQKIDVIMGELNDIWNTKNGFFE
jgi:hypothetical protein